MKNVFIVVLCSLFLVFAYAVNLSYAAYVQEGTVLLNGDSDKMFSVVTDFVADVTYDRGAKHQSKDMEVDFYGIAPGLIYKDKAMIYGGIGAGSVKETYDINGSKVEWESEYGLTWLVGGCVKFLEREVDWFDEAADLFITSDIQYRNTDLDTDTVALGSEQLTSAAIQYSSMEYNDWHVALTCGLEVGKWMPYIGAKYSDFESCVRLRTGNVVYQKDNAEADDNFGGFIGLNFNLEDRAIGKIQAGFIDEESVSGALTLKF
ncbi:MAG: hypothetical protein ABIB11_01925 [Candidatus Omnitrophota bacterium]